MPDKIQLLTDEVIGKIAAGEVVERPAAAIKELVENSLDAGATAVTVEIREGGISYFRVTDNGSGIRQGDIRLAFERHATSKIRVSEDLVGIQTLGFRGEALASIAAVAHVTCTTRTKEDASGIKVQNDGGRITAIEETACPQGTTIVVKDLFFNQPVRLKFLKKPVTEAGFVSDYMMRLILSRPDVSFRYISQGKTVYHSAGDGQLESAVFSIYGNEMLRSMRKVSGCESGLVMNGYVGVGESGRGNRGHQSFFINGRYMKAGVLSAAVEAAVRERVMIGKYPTCVLHITMPYELVDVNVHPNKLEVRFQNEQAVAQAVEHIVHDAIQDRDALEHPVKLTLTPEAPAVRQVSVVKEETAIKEQSAAAQPIIERVVKTAAQTNAKQTPVQNETVVPRAPIQTAKTVASRTENRPQSAMIQTVQSASMPKNNQSGLEEMQNKPKSAEQEAASLVLHQPQVTLRSSVSPAPPVPMQAEQATFLQPQPKPMRIIGTVFKTYILVEYDDQLLLIDQHAVHERLMYERLSAEWDRHQAGQEMLVPYVMTVTPREHALIEENKALLESFGMRVDDFGVNEVAVRTVPMILGEAQAGSFLRELLDQLAGERGVATMEKRRTSILQSACKHAVKGGDELSESDVRYLVTRMVDEKVTPTCPHGRPLVIALSHAELDKKFRRIQ